MSVGSQVRDPSLAALTLLTGAAAVTLNPNLYQEVGIYVLGGVVTVKVDGGAAIQVGTSTLYRWRAPDYAKINSTFIITAAAAATCHILLTT